MPINTGIHSINPSVPIGGQLEIWCPTVLNLLTWDSYDIVSCTVRGMNTDVSESSTVPLNPADKSKIFLATIPEVTLRGTTTVDLVLNVYNSQTGQSLTNTFSEQVTLLPAAPIIYGMTPDTLIKGSTWTFKLTGDNFYETLANRAKVRYRNITTGVTGQGSTVSGSVLPKSAMVMLPIVPAGQYEITFETESGSSIAPSYLTVQAGVGGNTTSQGPVIESQIPAAPSPMGFVTLTGRNFYGTVEVMWVQGAELIPTSGGNTTTVSMTLPPGFRDGDAVKVRTSSMGTSKESPEYHITLATRTPRLLSTSPASLAKDTAVATDITITGADLLSTKGNDLTIVGYGSVINNVINWSDTSILVRLTPATVVASMTNPTKFTFIATCADGLQATTVDLTLVDRGVPIIETVSPQPALTGQVFELRGQRYGTSGTVYINGNQFSATTWSDTVISAIVPDNAITGVVKIKRDGDNAFSNEKTITISPASANSAPYISILTPSSGPVETSVTIVGANFGTYSAMHCTVSVGESLATVTSAKWFDDHIIITIPTERYGGRNWVQVRTANGLSNPKEFVVTGKTEPDGPPPVPPGSDPKASPVIDGSLPSYTAPGNTSVTIVGRYFGVLDNLSEVKFKVSDGTTRSLTIVTWEDNAIKVLLYNPANHSDSGDFVVYNSVGYSNPLKFMITPAAPVITSVAPNPPLVGATVTLTGTLFGAGAADSSNFVRFGATQADVLPRASITNWSNTSIQFVVPNSYDYSRAEVQVVSGGIFSNWFPFDPVFDANSLTDPTTISLVEIRNMHGQLVSSANILRPPIMNIPPGSPVVENLNCDKLDGLHWEDIAEYIASKASNVPGLIENLKSINNVFPNINNNIKLCGAENITVDAFPEDNEIVISIKLSDEAGDQTPVNKAEIVDYVKRIFGKNGISAVNQNGIVYIAPIFGLEHSQVARGNHEHADRPATYA